MYTVVTSRVCSCYLSEPGAGVERHEIGLRLTELFWLCEHLALQGTLHVFTCSFHFARML